MKKNNHKICIVKGCKTLVKPTDKSPMCNKHKSREFKRRNLAAYTYNILKINARRRGIQDILTYDEFLRFCNDTNYLELKGRGQGKFTIDRIDHKKGYELNNIRILEHTENCSKGAKEGNGTYIPDEDVPF